MELVLSNEQRMIRDGATQFFRELGVARLRAWRDGARDDIWKQVAELGWTGMTIAEDAGGVGMGVAEASLLAEAAGRVLAPEPFAANELASALLKMRPDWARRIAAGELVAVAWDERSLRNDLSKTETRALETDQGWALVGAKQDVIVGAEAVALLVTAKVGADLALFVVDRAADGVLVSAQQRIDSLPAARVAFEGAIGQRVDIDLAGIERAFDRATVVASAELLGLASAAFEMTLAYLREREQFGVAIGTFQALRHRAAKLYIALELARSAVMAAARMLDAGGDAVQIAQHVSLAKARMSDTALLVLDEAVQMHGGIGMTDEHDIGLYFKRGRVAAMTYGDGAFHRDRWATLGGY